MEEYHKIRNIFNRDPITHKLIEGEYTTNEFMYLADNRWTFTEKVDGANIRVMWNNEKQSITFGGKQDTSEIPHKLYTALSNLFTVDKMSSTFDKDACLYGEGYGAGIQKGGGNYRLDQSFVLFDVKIDGFFLYRSNVLDISEKLEIPIVPIVGGGNLTKAVKIVKEGFKSKWGDFRAEGLVCRPIVELQARNGERIIVKIKHRDFLK